MSSKSQKIRFWYGVFLSVITMLVALVFIIQVADIYYGGPSADGKNYTVDIIAAHLALPLSFLGVWILAVIAGFVLSVVYPLEEKRRPYSDSKKALARLKKRLPAEGEGEGFALAKKKVKFHENLRLAVWLSALAVCLAGAIYILVYVFDASHYSKTDFIGDMLLTVKNMMPWVGVGLLLCCAAATVELFSVKRELEYVKTMMKTGDRTTVPAAKQPLTLDEKRKNIIVLVARIAVCGVAIAFVIAGIFNGGAQGVLDKAIAICTECIGLG